MTTNDKIKAVVEEFEEEFAPFIAECFHYDTGHSIAPYLSLIDCQMINHENDKIN